jgi:adenylate kinase family enzyme
MQESIILIGPMNTGKSTLGKLLSEKTGLPQFSLDDLRWKYYEEAGFGRDKVDTHIKKHGFLNTLWYWKKYEAYTVERTFEDHTRGVFDFGGGHSVYKDPELFNRVNRCLHRFDNVVLILPSENKKESIEILKNQGHKKREDWMPELIEHFVQHPSNSTLAKYTVYTKGKTPEISRDEILTKLKK